MVMRSKRNILSVEVSFPDSPAVEPLRFWPGRATYGSQDLSVLTLPHDPAYRR